jgi:cellulose synthase/poly-beta-1,6-N-acetylglucosamine synthase-like glycosyltransferase
VIDLLNRVLSTILLFSITYFTSVLFFAFLSMRDLAKSKPGNRETPRELALRSTAPGVTLIMPAYNEEVVIVETVRSAMANRYPNLEIIVISDGSKDRTVEVLVEAFDLLQMQAPAVNGPIHCSPARRVFRSRTLPTLTVIDKAPAGAKGDGANLGLNFASMPWVVVMDADELIDPDALVHAMTEIIHTPGNPIACGITLLPTNGCEVDNGLVLKSPVPKKFITGCQIIEYLTSYLIAKPGMNAVGAMSSISGGFGIFRRDVVMKVNGFTHPHLGEDMDMVVRMHRMFLESGEDYCMVHAPQAVAWTEFPFRLDILKRQRIRWHRGLRMVLKVCYDMMFRPRYGRFGMIGLPFLFLFEWIAVITEAAGYIMLVLVALFGTLNVGAVLSMFLAGQAISTAANFTAVYFAVKYLPFYKKRSDVARLLLWAFVSQFGFRQLTLVWRIRSLFPGGAGWGVMPRAGYAKPAT